MRRLIAFVLAVAGCASMAAIPGGPEDHAPPKVLAVVPESGAVNVRDKAVVFRFDEVVSDRSGPTGDLNGLVLISPRDGDPRISWKRNRLEIRPGRNWHPNTAYSVTLLPGLMDLSNNVTKAATTIVFSTGPVIPHLGLTGHVFDWMAERIAPGARVEAISRPDSIVYVGVTDSTGGFSLGPFDAGTYTVRAYLDQNRNQALDAGELWDSLQVQVTDSVRMLELLAAKRDTIGPRMLTVDQDDTTLLRITFDKPLSPSAPVNAEHFRVQRADSTPLVATWARTESAVKMEREQAISDSVRHVDSLAAIRDTSLRFPRPAPRPPPGAPPPPRKPSRPAPAIVVLVKLDPGSRLEPQKQYVVTAIDMPNLLGYKATTRRQFASKPAVKADSTKPPGVRPPRASAP